MFACTSKLPIYNTNICSAMITCHYILLCLPVVMMLIILNLEIIGLLNNIPGFFTHTDTVPALNWETLLMGTKVMGCLTDVQFIKSMPVVVVLTMYSMADRPASSDGFHDTCKTCSGKTRTLNGPTCRSECEGMQLILRK